MTTKEREEEQLESELNTIRKGAEELASVERKNGWHSRRGGVCDQREAGATDALASPCCGGARQVIVGDMVYGYDAMRSWLENQRRNYVLAVPETHLIWCLIIG